MTGDTQAKTLKRLPLDAWHRANGARMVPFAGYEMPLQFQGIIPEHEWTRSRASLFDVSHMGQLQVHGVGAVEGLEFLLPADIKGLQVGALRYSLLLDDDGGILDDLIVTRLPDGFYVVVNGSMKEQDIAWMRERLPAGVQLDVIADRALLALQGPAAFDVLNRHVSGANPLSDLKFMRAGQFEIAGKPAWISRCGYTGEDGFEISFPAGDIAMLADLLCQAPEVKPAGLGSRDSLRLEAGLPLYGNDLSRDTDPISAGLGFAISKRRRTEGGFTGAERIQALLEGKPRKKLVGLALSGRMPAREEAPVLAGESQIGTVTSGAFSPTLKHPIALAYISPTHIAVGTTLDILVRGQRLTAQVVALPFVPHRYHR